MSDTTHAEKVEMLQDYDLATLAGMWVTLIHFGTEKAKAEFETAMEELGYTLDGTGLYWS